MPHVFISYVRENQEIVDRLCKELQASGVRYWLDREKINPGERWQYAIRDAIESGVFFVACFSNEYVQRSTSYMNEELVLAIEQLRLRPINRTWFIPVRLSDCTIPSLRIGGGDTLRHIQWVDLYGDNWHDGIRRLVQVVLPTVHTLEHAEIGSRKTAKSAHYEVRIHDGALRLGSSYEEQYWYHDPTKPANSNDWRKLDLRVWDNHSLRVSEKRIGDAYDVAIIETSSTENGNLEIVILDSESNLYHSLIWKNEEQAKKAELQGQGSTYHGQTPWNLVTKFAGRSFGKPSRIVEFYLTSSNSRKLIIEDTNDNLWSAERNFDGYWTPWSRIKTL